MGFAERINLAQRFEFEVEAFCLRKFISVAKNGTEHTHPTFVELLRRRNDAGSKLVRFAPDGVALQTSGVWHWEAKASINIEKDAYETYMAYHEMGARVLLFVKPSPNSAVFLGRVERIGFVPSADVVGRYKPDRRHPVDADDWICPRLGHGNAGFGSGTPYKEIDVGSLAEINDFYE